MTCLSKEDTAAMQEWFETTAECVNGALGPGHGCVVRDAEGALWSVYHQQKDGTQPWNRFICIDPLWFDEKGILHGKATRGTPQPAPATEAEGER